MLGTDSKFAPQPFILGHQRPVFDRLLEIGNACFSIQHVTLPVRPRTASLLVGPTGSGKTFLVREAARALDASVYFIAISDWILLGCSERGAETTWTSIFRFLHKNRTSPGVVIFLDEICKLGVVGESSYDRHLRVEAFQLLDLTVPRNLKDSEGNVIDGHHYAEAQEVLSNRTLLIGAGAFQDLWETRSSVSIGFGHSQHTITQAPTPDELTKILPRELVNRFRRELLVLRPLEKSDYASMLQRTACAMPSYLQETFLRIGREKLDEAFAMQQGCRFLEDLLLDTILAERALIRGPQDLKENPGLPMMDT